MTWITVRRLYDDALIGPFANRSAAETWMRADWLEFCVGPFDPDNYLILDLRDPSEQLSQDRAPVPVPRLPRAMPDLAWDAPLRSR